MIDKGHNFFELTKLAVKFVKKIFVHEINNYLIFFSSSVNIYIKSKFWTI